MSIELDRDTKFRCAIKSVQDRVAVIGHQGYITELLRHQLQVMDSELGDVIELGGVTSENAKKVSGATMDPQTEGYMLSALEQCLMHRYLGYCTIDSCIDFSEINKLIERAGDV